METDDGRYKVTPLPEYLEAAQTACTLPELLALGA